MNWKSVKIYLIFILAAVNIYLAASYISSQSRNMRLDSEAVANTVSFLQKNGVSIEKNVIPEQLYNSNIVETPYEENYYENIATVLSDSEKESVNILPDNSIRIMMQNGSVFTFDSKFGFSFYNSDRIDEIDKTPALFSAATFTEQQPTKEQLRVLKRFLYPYDKSTSKIFDIEITSAQSDTDGYLYISCVQTVYNTPVNNNTVMIKMADNEITDAEGTWYFPSGVSVYTYEQYDQLSILFKDAGSNKLSGNISGNENEHKINALDYIYCIYWNATRDKIYFIPAWRITYDGGDSRIYNAVNCELYE